MRLPILSLILAAAAGAQQAPLLCPPAPAGRPCEAFHYHVAMFRPDPRGFAELAAVQPFATQAACERAREAAIAANEKVVAAMRAEDERFEADKFGPCHCDMTALTEEQRAQQLRTAEDIRLRVRERLLDENVPSDSEAARALYFESAPSPALGAPKIVPLPAAPPAPLVTSADDLEPTRTFDTTRPAVAALDLPLVDIASAEPAAALATTGGTPAPAPAEQAAASPPAAAPAPVAAPEPVVEQTVAPEPVVEQTVAAEPVIDAPVAADEEDETEDTSAEAAAERFISYETERIQNVLRASAAIVDEDLKTKIFEACMQRIQLLSNLRLLIEGSGSRSALAAAAREAQTEADRLALVARLFGESVKPHWAPHDAADVIFDVDATVAAAPERALRDTTGRFPAEQKKHALYLVLAQTQPSEDQRLWLSSVVEGFLR